MSKFTSGKWEIHDTKPYMIKAPGSPFLALAVSLSDARLIAAAPEMYELLKVWVNVQAQPTLRVAQARARQLLSRIDGDADVEAQESAP